MGGDIEGVIKSKHYQSALYIHEHYKNEICFVPSTDSHLKDLIAKIYFYLCLCMPTDARRGCQNPWNWSYRLLYAVPCGCWVPNLGPLGK